MKELLLPRTDAGVFVQAAVAFVVLTMALVAVRRDRELRLFVIGVAVLATAWFALRSVHERAGRRIQRRLGRSGHLTGLT